MKSRALIATWDDRVSTTLDFASAFLLVETEGAREVSRRKIVVDDQGRERLPRMIRDLKADVVLCGAVSCELARTLICSGIRVVPFLSGPVNSVLAAYFCHQLEDPRYLLAGATPGAGRRWRHGCAGHGNHCARERGGTPSAAGGLNRLNHELRFMKGGE